MLILWNEVTDMFLQTTDTRVHIRELQRTVSMKHCELFSSFIKLFGLENVRQMWKSWESFSKLSLFVFLLIHIQKAPNIQFDGISTANADDHQNRRINPHTAAEPVCFRGFSARFQAVRPNLPHPDSWRLTQREKQDECRCVSITWATSQLSLTRTWLQLHRSVSTERQWRKQFVWTLETVRKISPVT